jgi:hypothetical protein
MGRDQMMQKLILLTTFALLGGRSCFALECSINLSDCFKNSVPALEAGDSRLQKYENEAKKYLKSLKKAGGRKGLSFPNKSVLLNGWTVVENATRSGKNAVLLRDTSGKQFVFTWSDGRGFDPEIDKDCAQNEPTEFLTGEVHTHAEVSSGIIVVGECGIKKVFYAVRK